MPRVGDLEHQQSPKTLEETGTCSIRTSPPQPVPSHAPNRRAFKDGAL